MVVNITILLQLHLQQPREDPLEVVDDHNRDLSVNREVEDALVKALPRGPLLDESLPHLGDLLLELALLALEESAGHRVLVDFAHGRAVAARVVLRAAAHDDGDRLRHRVQPGRDGRRAETARSTAKCSAERRSHSGTSDADGRRVCDAPAASVIPSRHVFSCA